MNLVGKILVVAVLVMSVAFASLTLTVHATHKHWMLIVDNASPKAGEQPGLKQVIAERDTFITRLQAELQNKQQLFERTLRESEQIRGQLESANSELQTTRKNLDAEILKTSTLLADAINAGKTSASVLETTQKDNANIRAENLTVKAERDKHFDDVVKKGDDLAQATGEWARLSERNKQLLSQFAQYRLVMQDRGLPLNLDVPSVYGLVTQTHTAEKMVEINLGSDDGLKTGVEMDVYRMGANLADTRYLARIRLTVVDKTSAVGNLIQGTVKGTIQKDDHVATRIVTE